MKLIVKFIIAIIILLLIASYFVGKKQASVDFVSARNDGYADRYSTGEYMLNFYRTGNKESEYKIIGISDIREDDFSVLTYYINDDLKELVDLIYIDRAGYGLSEDTMIEQNIEKVVNDYRNALEKAEIKGPFILMAHGYGSIFATFWESKFPNEVKAVIYIDGDIFEENNKVEEFDYLDYFKLISSKLSLNRYIGETETVSDYFSPELVSLSKIMNLRSSYTNTKIYESKNKKVSMDEAYKNIIENNIPKIYITSSVFKTTEEYKSYLKWYNKRLDSFAMTTEAIPSDDELSKKINDFKMYEIESIIPFTEKLGNTEVIELLGREQIFEERHKDLSDTIREFVLEL